MGRDERETARPVVLDAEVLLKYVGLSTHRVDSEVAIIPGVAQVAGDKSRGALVGVLKMSRRSCDKVEVEHTRARLRSCAHPDCTQVDIINGGRGRYSWRRPESDAVLGVAPN